ncbi:hypothetical protein BJX66DRAFT_180867 [Aspergillus keveii]|uniref:SET domain-containing protein n=1 Tax=Aspergillus keveii TaxID=714993 RepID=A0ABR4GM38_9EURO
MSGIRVALGSESDSDSDYDSNTDSESEAGSELGTERNGLLFSSERETTPDEDEEGDSSSNDAGLEGLKEQAELDIVTETVIASVSALQLGVELGEVAEKDEKKDDAEEKENESEKEEQIHTTEPAEDEGKIESDGEQKEDTEVQLNEGDAEQKTETVDEGKNEGHDEQKAEFNTEQQNEDDNERENEGDVERKSETADEGKNKSHDKQKTEGGNEQENGADGEQKSDDVAERENEGQSKEEKDINEEAKNKKEDEKKSEAGGQKLEEEESILVLPVPPPISPISPIFPIPRPVTLPTPPIKPAPLAICAPSSPSESSASSPLSASPSSPASSSATKTQTQAQRQAEIDTEAALASYLKEIDGNTNSDGAEDAREELLQRLPTNLPFPPPSGTEIKEEILPATAFERRLVNKDMGYGLVALQTIRAGAVIFVDQLVTVWQEEQESCRKMDEANAMIRRKARKHGKVWFKQFMALSRPKVKEYGIMGGIWDAHHLPTTWSGKRGGIIGLNLAYINHGCIPNAFLTYESIYPLDKEGIPQYDQQPQLGRAVVRAITEIRAGVEICISYGQTPGTAKMRQDQTNYHFGFTCACRVCAKPTESFENALHAYQRLEPAFNDRFLIANKPALALKLALDLIKQLRLAYVYDNRLAMIWVKCAMIAGHHSDLARAHCFLSRARQLVFLLEGPSGDLYRQVRNWWLAPRLMPGFGGTQRGLSSVKESLKIYRSGSYSKQILFMSDATPGEYIRVSRYKKIPAATKNEQAGGDAEGKDDEEKDKVRWEIVDGLDPIPPKLDIDKEPPIHEWCSVENCRACRRTDRREKRIRESRESRKGGEKKEKEKEEVKEEEKEEKGEEKEVCTDPKTDFARLLLNAVDAFEHSDGEAEGSADAKKKKTIGKRPRRGSKWYLDALKYPRILTPDLDTISPAECAAGCNCVGLQQAEGAESVQSSENLEGEQKAKKKKRKGKKKKNNNAEPVIQDVGGERKVVLVEASDAGVGSSATVEQD